jgi:SIT4-associating protein SAP185/190
VYICLQADQPVPLIPPPPPPLNITPSRARRRLADRLALHKQQASQEALASAIDPNDPFASLGDNDDQDATGHFTLDEDEQDITASGNRHKSSLSSSSSNENSAGFSVSRGLTSLFSTRRDENFGSHGFDKSLEDSSSSEEGSGSDPEDSEHPPLEARRSLERQPLDIDDDDEMGEMVAPEESNGDRASNSSDEEELSESEKEKLRVSSFEPSTSGGRPSHLMDDESEGRDAEFQDEEEEDEEEEGDELVEIAMPVSMGDGRRNSMGRG